MIYSDPTCTSSMCFRFLFVSLLIKLLRIASIKEKIIEYRFGRDCFYCCREGGFCRRATKPTPPFIGEMKISHLLWPQNMTSPPRFAFSSRDGSLTPDRDELSKRDTNRCRDGKELIIDLEPCARRCLSSAMVENQFSSIRSLSFLHFSAFPVAFCACIGDGLFLLAICRNSCDVPSASFLTFAMPFFHEQRCGCVGEPPLGERLFLISFSRSPLIARSTPNNLV